MVVFSDVIFELFLNRNSRHIRNVRDRSMNLAWKLKKHC